jgi:hypothetical protein
MAKKCGEKKQNSLEEIKFMSGEIKKLSRSDPMYGLFQNDDLRKKENWQ